MANTNLLKLSTGGIFSFRETREFTTSLTSTISGNGNASFPNVHVINSLIVSANTYSAANQWFSIRVGANYLAYKQPLVSNNSVIVINSNTPIFLTYQYTLSIQASSNSIFNFTASGVRVNSP